MSVESAAAISAVGFVVIAVFQAALAAGAPLGRAAWGGRTAVLPARLRRSSAVAVVIWLVAAAIILGRAGLIDVPLPEVTLTVGAWVLVVLSALGSLVNVASSSPWERFGWAPLAATLAVLSAVVASSPV
ncbi:MAG TPA: hypothetical protein VIF63_00085 [Candidatus Limnocylindrales bacterium]